MTTVKLGNPNPMMLKTVQMEDGPNETTLVEAKHLNQSVTTVDMSPGFDDSETVELALSTTNDRVLNMIARSLGAEHRQYTIGIQELEGVLTVHAGGVSPTWVSCPDDPAFEAAIAHHFDCAQGEPTALLTNAGRDGLHAQHMSTSAQPATFNYLALTANSTAPSAASTTLTGEITTGGGGLIRAQATYAHTAGTNVTTLTKTFTANGSDSLPVTVAKLGVFNAASVGTLGYETLLNATATLTAIGDSVAVTETVTIG